MEGCGEDFVEVGGGEVGEAGASESVEGAGGGVGGEDADVRWCLWSV